MGKNAELSDFADIVQSPHQGTRGVVLDRSTTREYISVRGRTTVQSHNNINVDEVISAVACSSCGEVVIVRGWGGEHTGEGSVHTYTYAPTGHCTQCGEFCEAWVLFHVDGTNLRLHSFEGQINCTAARIPNPDQFKKIC
ncbi:hypothetical protein [Halorubrum sp. Ea8]|uniref:hypothetical protein n=1 Tax=Halorubrum sp. Ea8 TaxID=1383841 RepID=UPI0011401163|nr:hypothetical protein [Halorubrum sp. Ea8]